MLENKNILVGVTGSIAIYKTLELIRLYIKAGANVKVIMTESAKKFITPLTFETISQSKVIDDTNESWEKESIDNHIAIGKWAELFVLAPCSVNTINKIRHGIADNILTQALIAYEGKKLLAPAANTNMLHNSITQKSLKELKVLNYKFVEPISKELACRDVGNGAMSEVEDIYFATIKELICDEYWVNRKVVLSGGGTVERIDDVRYISNFSSGKMASALALALYLKGAKVTLVSSRGHDELPKEIHVISVESSEEMYEALVDSMYAAKKGVLAPNQEWIEKQPYLFMVAAVSDYLPSATTQGKMKKEMLGESWSLDLKQNMDILKSLPKDGFVSVGFKAEMNSEVAFLNASNMLKAKELDAVCLNVIDESNGFGSSTNQIELIYENETFSFGGEKLSLSLELVDNLSKRFND